ncbi:hypothetical protein V2G26_020128 [Clonostachys chloroleuca]
MGADSTPVWGAMIGWRDHGLGPLAPTWTRPDQVGKYGRELVSRAMLLVSSRRGLARHALPRVSFPMDALLWKHGSRRAGRATVGKEPMPDRPLAGHQAIAIPVP